jgi:methylglutaconyl-CoA hydratase
MDHEASNNPILWHLDERGVAYVTLNRPQVYNAYNGEMIAALLAAFDKLARESARVIVITGNGRNFQAGADVKWLDAVRRSSPADNLRASRMTAEAIQRLNMVPIPTLALVQGSVSAAAPE